MKLKICGKTYRVQKKTRKQMRKYLGRCNNHTQTISIRSDLADETKADVLLHEVTHALDYATLSGLEERQVHAVSTAMLGFFYDNPRAVKWLMKKKK